MVIDCIFARLCFHLGAANSGNLNRSTPENMLLECDFYAQRGTCDRTCFSDKSIPCENTGRMNTMAVGGVVHADYPQVRTGSSGGNRSKSSLSAILMDERFYVEKVGKSGSQGKQLPG